jgi:hypothetical protein
MCIGSISLSLSITKIKSAIYSNYLSTQFAVIFTVWNPRIYVELILLGASSFWLRERAQISRCVRKAVGKNPHSGGSGPNLLSFIIKNRGLAIIPGFFSGAGVKMASWFLEGTLLNFMPGFWGHC